MKNYMFSGTCKVVKFTCAQERVKYKGSGPFVSGRPFGSGPNGARQRRVYMFWRMCQHISSKFTYFGEHVIYMFWGTCNHTEFTCSGEHVTTLCITCSGKRAVRSTAKPPTCSHPRFFPFLLLHSYTFFP